MGQVVKGLDKAMQSMDLQKVSGLLMIIKIRGGWLLGAGIVGEWGCCSTP